MSDKISSKGKFIAFEGIDGSGKSTQISCLTNRLKQNGISIYNTFEPTDSPIGSVIKQMMTGRIHGQHETIAALFVADRLDHLLNVTNGMLSKVAQGITVLTDRYYFSSYAYHSAHVEMDWVIAANALSAKILKPDINIFLDASPETCIKRLRHGRFHLELYENFETLQSVRDNYFKAFKKLKHAENILIIDADRSADEIADDIWIKTRQLHEQ